MSDNVNHPAHYNREGRKECIVEMQELFGIEAVKNFCLLNAYKYLYRNGLKIGAKTDLAKSKWYFNKYAELGSDISEIEKVQKAVSYENN